MLKHYKIAGVMVVLLLSIMAIPYTIAQSANSYSFTPLPGTFTPLIGPTPTSILVGADTGLSTAFPIGFSFDYSGTAYTTVQATADGVLLFGSGKTSTLTNNLATATATQRPGVAPLWDDLQCSAGVTYQVSGTPSNQVLTVEWLNMEWNYNSATPAISFQVKLYQATGVIEFIYRQETTAANLPSASIGIMGVAPTDYISLQNTSAAPTISTIASTNTLNAKPATGQIYQFAPPPPTPPTPTQAAGTPSCATGTQLDLAGPPPANVTWYWQTTATGTSMAIPYSGPYSVFANGTYYARAYNSVSLSWSVASSSYTVSNFPLATAPPAPVAAQDPSCAPAGTNLTVAAAPVGYVYYWQGTVAGGISMAQNAATPYNATASGTYYVAAYETASSCWSVTTGTAITVSTLIPNVPTVTTSTLNICAGATSAIIDASGTSFTTGTLATTQAGGNGCTNGNMFNLTAGSQAVTLTSIDVTPNTTSTQNVLVYYKAGTYVGSEATVGAWTLVGTYSINGVTATPVGVDHADFTIPAGATYGIYVNYNAQYTDASTTYSNSALTMTTGAGFCTAFSGPIAGRTFNGTIHYTTGSAATVAWFNAATNGTQVGSGSPFEAAGTSVMPSPATLGSYNFYPASYLNGCYSATAPAITVNVANVNAALIPVNATCNGLANGSFTLGTIQCGTQPFTYSVDGGTYGPIPANLPAGTHTIIIRDQGLLFSSPISVVVTEPSAPTALVANATYFNAVLGWTAQGNETSWVIEYGPTGFTPGTGQTILNATNPDTITGLTANTAYQYYVSAGCASGSDFAGPFSFSTDPGFLVWNNACIPFNDISTTGTNANLTDDSEAGVTLPWPWNINGTTVNTITIGNNGGLLFNTLTGNIAYTATGNGMFPYVQDLDDVLAGGGVYYQSIGTAPNRQFIVQWTDMPHFSTGTDGATFQVVVDEATSEFYYLYSDVMMSNTLWNNGTDAEIAAITSNGTVTVSMNNAAYLTNNSCIHFYNTLCPNVTNIVVDEHEIDADITWNAGLYGETNWTIIYGPTGFDPLTEGDTAVSTTTTVNLFPLTQNTEYDFYIYSECALDDLTSSGVMGNFTTIPFCSTPGSLTAQTDIDSLEATWSWTQNINFPGYAIESFSIQYGMTGFELGTGTMYTANGTNNADTVFSTAFLSGGVYQYYLQAVCGTNDSVSSWVGPITFTMPLANDNACLAETIAVDGPVYTFNNTGATSVGEGAIAPPATGAQTTDGWINQTLNGTVWYKFVAPASGSVRVDATGIDYNGQAAVYSVNTCSNFATYNLLAANDNAIGGTSLAPNFTVCGLTAGNTYYLLFDGFNATTGNYSLKLSSINLEAGLANTTPLTLNVCSGTNVELFNTITGEQTGGVWSSDIAAVNSSITGSDLETNGLAYNTFNLQYRITDGCAYDSVIGKVKVFAPSYAGTDGTITACRNQPVNLLAGLEGTADLGGTWYTPGGAPTAEGSYITTANTQGNYNFTYISGNGVCPNDTALVVVNVMGSCNELGVSEQIFAGVEVFPNPSAGIVFVTSDINFNYEVTDANGRVVTTSQNGVKAAQKTEINLSDVERGVYFIRLNNEDAQKTYRIVIN